MFDMIRCAVCVLNLVEVGEGILLLGLLHSLLHHLGTCNILLRSLTGLCLTDLRFGQILCSLACSTSDGFGDMRSSMLRSSCGLRCLGSGLGSSSCRNSGSLRSLDRNTLGGFSFRTSSLRGTGSFLGCGGSFLALSSTLLRSGASC